MWFNYQGVCLVSLGAVPEDGFISDLLGMMGPNVQEGNSRRTLAVQNICTYKYRMIAQ